MRYVPIDNVGVAQLQRQRQLIERFELQDLEKAEQTRAVRIHDHYYFVSVLHGDCVVYKFDEHRQELLEVYCEVQLLLQLEEEPLVTSG